jgi:polysaccharide pyruvyl transferase WcaK-like protein
MADAPVERLRLFHFDIKTFGNYGDTLLFEAVRQLFNGFGGGQYFEIYDSRPLRDPVSSALVSYINDTVDAVVVGGGGLFLRDTNPNERSGWQWNISVDLLKKLKKPLIIFAVGNNRFIDQEDFSPTFREHLNLTMDRSVFFGLRNTGSIETIRPYLAEQSRDRVEFQPCPTTLGRYLFPDVWRPEPERDRHLGLQALIGRRQRAVGFDPDRLYADLIDVAERLVRDGWTLESMPYASGDTIFANLAANAGVPMEETRLFDDPDGLYKGVEASARLPYMLGTRGHAQMVPFGMGAIPLSILVHNKLGYFARDIGHPEFVVDPRQDDFPIRLYETIRAVADNRSQLRAELDVVRERFLTLSLSNLAAIYERLTGRKVPQEHVAYTQFERRLAETAYRQARSRDRSDQLVRELTDKPPNGQAVKQSARQDADRLFARAKAAAARGAYGEARVLLRGVDVVCPDYFAARSRPRWDSGPLRAVPSRLIPVLQRANNWRPS